MKEYQIPALPLKVDFDTIPILKQLGKSKSTLAELKGLVQSIPNEAILINTLAIQEAKDSSEVENIVTTHDDLYKSDLKVTEFINSAATKEVMNYREAIHAGFNSIRSNKLITNNVIKEVRGILVGNAEGFRTKPGTNLANKEGLVYLPPQAPALVQKYMDDLEAYINTTDKNGLDPLIKNAVIHHQFESIHPFTDGNGRTGRILSILLLVANELLDLPILYLSRYITHNKSEYYRLLQAIRDNENNESNWHNWVMFFLKGIEETALDTILLVKRIKDLMIEYKQILRPALGKSYRHELLNHLFYHPYTKIEFIEQVMQVRRKTAAKYLERIVDIGLLKKMKWGNSNYYINVELYDILLNRQEQKTENV